MPKPKTHSRKRRSSPSTLPEREGRRNLDALSRTTTHPAPAGRSLAGEGEERKTHGPRVLISDALSPAAVQIFKDRGVEVDFQPNLGKDKDKLAAAIDGFDGLAIRSATKVTAKMLESAKSLKVIGRAGIGVDNVDIPAATARGIIVMNTPFGNSITTAEHAITLMLSLARQIPEADASTRAGKWEKNKFLGVEIFSKDARRDRLRQYRLDRRRPRDRPEDEGDRLRSVSLRRARASPRRRKGRARRTLAPRRFHHAAHPVDRKDPQHHQCRSRSPRPKRASA